MPGAMRGWILPSREGGPFRLSCCTVCIVCHGEGASPGAGRAVYPTILVDARLADMKKGVYGCALHPWTHGVRPCPKPVDSGRR